VRKRKKLSLMPAIALTALGLMVALPTLSSMSLHAATATRYSNTTVRNGQTLGSIAAAHTGETGDIQETIDRISEANHLGSAPIQPGQHLRIPD
jgi:predicted Zn-dependent protease